MKPEEMEDVFNIEDTREINEELDAMFEIWAERGANPLAVCTIVIIRMIALSGQLFDDEEDYETYVRGVAKGGMKYFEEIEKKAKQHVH